MKTYSVFVNGSSEVTDTSHEKACDVFAKSFHANDKYKHIAMHEHNKDKQGDILSTRVVLEVLGKPKLSKVNEKGKATNDV